MNWHIALSNSSASCPQSMHHHGGSVAQGALYQDNTSPCAMKCHAGFDEQLKAMTDAQVRMAQDIAALQSGQPSVRSPQAQQSGQQGASNINSDVQNSPDAVASPSGAAANSPATVIGTSGAASNSPGPSTGAGGAAANSPAAASTSTSTDGRSASLDQRLTALTAEVCPLHLLHHLLLRFASCDSVIRECTDFVSTHVFPSTYCKCPHA